jgi:3-oxoacyl-[acyl-carrier protein] reductase
MNIDLSGKTAVVTGGGAGIGRAIAEAYADAGARVVVAEIDAGRADDVRAALQAKGGDSLVSVTDVRNTQQVATLFEEVERRFGGLDILVNNVGDFLQIAKPFERYTDDDFEALYQTNLRSVFICSRAAIPLIRKGGKGGSIISVSSIEAFRGIPMTSVYPQRRAGGCR